MGHLYFSLPPSDIDPPETNMYFISNWSIFRMWLRMVCDVSVIKRTRPKGKQLEFPLPYPKRVKKKRNITFRTLHSEKNINCAMLILIFVHDIYAQEFK